MFLELDDERRAIRDMARQFAAAELSPHAKGWDASGHFPVPTLRRAAELGMAAIYVREDAGGSGLGRLEAALIFEELAAGCTSTAAYLSIHNMVGWMVDAFGDNGQRERFLSDLVSMRRLGSYCLTEPDAGSDAGNLRTTARRDGEVYVLNGSKAFISGAGVSDVYVVMARTGDPGPGGISAFILEKGMPGLEFGAQEQKLGWKSQPTALVTFDDCRVPAANRLGAEGQGFTVAMQALDGGRVNIGACSLGAAQICLERTLTYTKERHQFGQRIADFQNTRFKLADMATGLDAARLMVWRAAAMLDRGDLEGTMACAMAKRFATDVAFDVVDEALQLHGGYGYLQDFEIERFLRDVRVHRILEGTNEIMRVIIARHLLAS